MALLKNNMSVRGIGVTPLSLTMPAGRSARITDINLFSFDHAAENVLITIDRKTIQHFAMPIDEYLVRRQPQNGVNSIYQRMREYGLIDPIPLAEGQTLTINAQTATDEIELVYDLYDGGDVRADEKNGSEGKIYQLFQVISNSVAKAASGDVDLDQSDISSVFPRFPGGEVVPPGTTMTLRALFGNANAGRVGAPLDYYTTALKLMRNREDILSQDMSGMTWRGNEFYDVSGYAYQTLRGRMSSGRLIPRAEVCVINPPIVFAPGDELLCRAVIVWAGNTCPVGAVKLGLLFDVAVG